MTIPIISAISFILLVLGVGVALWFVSRWRLAAKSKGPAEPAAMGSTLAFRWGYIMLPLAVLLLSVIVAAYFYHRLPAELAYHFGSDGSPDRWLGRGVVLLLTLLPQLFLTLLAGAITWGVARLAAGFRLPVDVGLKPESILLFMGNMVALPQIILGFAMLDIFSYNSYQIHILPLWVFALIIMVVGGIILSVFFIQTLRQASAAK